MMYWWKRAREHHHRGEGAHCHPGGGGGCGPGGGGGAWSRDDAGTNFGVRRPLRFLAHKLELSDAQVKELARIMNDLKTERAQAEVDQQRTLNAFADAIAGATFDAARAAEGLKQRTESAQKLRDAVEKALTAMHALLNEDQRARFAYLLRTGTVLI